MALSITNILSASFPDVVKARNAKGFDQWSESAFLRALDEGGFIKRVDLGSTIEVPLDYQINAGATTLATDITATSLSKTAILGSASYAIGEVTAPIVWTKKDEATNPSANQKIAYVKQLIENGMNSHDQVIENCLAAATATNGIESIRTSITEDGTGTVGGIVAGTDTMWKNQFDDYGTETGAGLLGKLGVIYNACSKGTGSSNQPTLIATSPTQFGVFEAALTPNQRFINVKKANAAFESYAFRNASVVFSIAYTSDSYFFLNPNAIQLRVSREYFRHQGEVNEVDSANAYVTKIYSALQLVVTNRSRLGVSFT